MTSDTNVHQNDVVRCQTATINFSKLLIESSEFTSKVEFKVMQVLELLVRNRGQLVTRDTLHDTVWHDGFVNDDTLNRAISILRRELSAAGAKGVIRTIPRRGYEFTGEILPVEAELEPAPVLQTTTRDAHGWRDWFKLNRMRLVGPVAMSVLAFVIVVFASTMVSFTPEVQAAGIPSNSSFTQENMERGPIDERAIRSSLAGLESRGMDTSAILTAINETQNFEAAITQMLSYRDTVMRSVSTHEYIAYLHQIGAIAVDHNVDAALASYAEILQLTDQDGYASSQLARLYMGRGETEQARHHILTALDTMSLTANDRLRLEIDQVAVNDDSYKLKAAAFGELAADARLEGLTEQEASARLLQVNYEWWAAMGRNAVTEDTMSAWIDELHQVNSIFQRLELDRDYARSVSMMGLMLKVNGDLPAANAAFLEAFEIERLLMRPTRLHSILTNLAMTNFERELHYEAWAYNEDAIAVLRKANLVQDLFVNWILGARIALAKGSDEEACRLFHVAMNSWPDGMGYPEDLPELKSQLKCDVVQFADASHP
ncbi:MAG: hypothetical protein CMK07_15730 [Ponticaulis sp.]|nr:hypothetical protein [Ponticaulis sp.]